MKYIIMIVLLIPLISCDQVTFDTPLKKEQTEQKCCEQTEIGRYQIILGVIAGKQTYMIDTKTGRIWTYVISLQREGKPTFWAEDYVENNENCSYNYELFNESYPYRKSSNIKP